MDVTPDGYLVLEPRSLFDPCLIGVAHRGGEFVAVYSRKLVIQALIDDGLDVTDALEHYEYNVSGSLGWGYPMFMLEDDE